jgi:hypothetical protein
MNSYIIGWPPVNVGFEVLTAIVMNSAIFWDHIPTTSWYHETTGD